MTAALRVVDGAGRPHSVEAWTVAPAENAQLVAGDSVRFLAVGQLTITARVAVSSTASSTASSAVAPTDTTLAQTLDIASPPSVAFDLLASGNRDIYTVALDGTGFTRLTTDAADDRHPTSAGGMVVFVSARSGQDKLYTVPLTGGTAVRVTTGTTSEEDPALVANASRLAYVVVTNATLPRLWTALVSGANAGRDDAADGGSASAIEGQPSWSPSGDRVAYMSTRDGDAAIYVASYGGATGSATKIAGGTGQGGNFEPTWSPDGARVAFTSNRDGGTDLYLASASGGNATRLTHQGNLGEPAWLADGRLLLTRFVGTTSSICWIDPAAPDVLHVIDTGDGAAAHSTPLR